jgi:CheY-like chemotaxis protein/nitrogen-specific signal transduction histidine kinase
MNPPSDASAGLTLEQLRALEASNRMKSEFIANVSHELRTPIHAIIGYLDLLQDGIYGSLAPDQELTLQYIRDSANDLLNLINNLLDLTRIESGRTDLVLSAFDVRDLISEIIDQLKPLADTKHLALDAKISLDQTVIRTDRGKLKQILVNLLANALKFTDRGRVSLRVTPAPRANGAERFAISVADTGVGIPPDKLERVFEKFYQLDSSASRAHDGTGLGLYITKQLLDLLDGDIQVESAPGNGATFTITLPRNYEEIAGIHRLRKRISEAAPAGAGHADQKRLVLVISSNPDTARILCDGLGSAEYSVRVAPSHAEALDIARRLRPLVILLDADHASPEIWPLFQELKLRPETKDIPTIFLSNQTANEVGAPVAVAAPLNHQEVLRSIRASTVAGNKNVLIVDDDPNIREILKCALADEGYRVAEAVDGQQAIDLIEAGPPDLVLLDIHVPKIDGWGVIRHLAQHEKLRHIEVLVITGDILSERETAAIHSHARGLIKKGEFKVHKVLEQVADLLEVN